MHSDKAEKPESEVIFFENEEELELLQLQTLKCISKSDQQEKSPTGEDIETEKFTDIPEKWKLTNSIELYDWQTEAVNEWFRQGHQGTMKVVTGGGKTLLALALAEKLQNSIDPELRVAVIVPTIVLMNQWYDELIKLGNLPESCIGRMGGGYKDEEFNSGCLIMICVLASASTQLADIVNKRDISEHLLLIVDECQSVGGSKTSKVLEVTRKYSLGLSATPERDNENETAYNEGPVGNALGEIIFRLTYAEALEEGLIPPFTIRHFALPLNAKEKTRYDQLSRSIKESRNELRNIAPEKARSGSSFFKWVSKKIGDSSIPAGKFIADTTRRKALLYSLESRNEAVKTLIDEELKINPDAQIILFHENIHQANRLFIQLRDAGYAVIAEHSSLTNSIRESGLDLFRRGIAKILVSVKSLIEGFNVPEVDVGIIVASSSSPRQRIQSMGRVMRRHRGKDGDENSSSIHILYAQNTVDESIYGKLNWERITGVARNIYYHWTPGEEPQLKNGPPLSPLPQEDEINTQHLKVGDEYPGEYIGSEFSCDNAMNIKLEDGSFAYDENKLAQEVIQIKGGAGQFRITPIKNLVLVRKKENEKWITRFVRRLDQKLETIKRAPETHDDQKLLLWAEKSNLGSLYPSQDPKMRSENWKFKQSGGGRISRKIRNGEAFARTTNHAKLSNKIKGERADELLRRIKILLSDGQGPLTKLLITEIGHVLYRKEGKLHFIADVKDGLEFPKSDNR